MSSRTLRSLSERSASVITFQSSLSERGSDGLSGLIQLDFHSAGLFGRDNEKEILMNAITRAHETNGSRELITISGKSGTGKTALATFGYQYLKEQRWGQAAAGAFERGGATDIFVIIALFESLCNKMALLDEIDEIRKSMTKEIGADSHFLMAYVPALSKLIQTHEIPQPTKRYAKRESFTAKSFQRLLQVLRKFLRQIARSVSTIVFQLDDLHNANKEALQLFSYLVADDLLTNVVFIITYRDDEVDEEHELAKQLAKLNDAVGHWQIVNVTVYDLDLDSVNQFVAAITDNTNLDITMALATVVHKKTRGNCFFVRQLLNTLCERGLLSFSFLKYQWDWNLDRIASEVQISDNVVDLIIGRIERLSRGIQVLLQLASCFGTSFDAYLVCNIATLMDAKDFGDTLFFEKCLESSSILASEPTKRQLAYLEKVIVFGLVERGPGNFLRFSHDRIQEASYEMIIGVPERARMHYCVGKLLFEHQSFPDVDHQWMFFTAIDHILKGQALIRTSETRVRLARQCLKAGEMARSRSSFMPAAQYFACGFDLLEGTVRWTNHYDLTLALCSSLAEMANCAKDEEACRAMTAEVSKHAKKKGDAIRAESALVTLLGMKGKQEDAIAFGFGVLRVHGEEFPRNPNKLHIAVQLIKTNKLLKNVTNEQLTTLPQMNNPEQENVLRIMAQMTIACWFYNKKQFLPLLYTRFMQITLKHGMSAYTSFSYANFAILLTAMGKIKEGYRYGKLALQLLDQTSPKLHSNVLLLVHMFIYHSANPLRSSLEPLLKGYDVGMQTLNVDFAFMCSYAYSSIYVHCGHPLPPLEIDMKRYMSVIRDYGQTVAYCIFLPLYQYVLTLMGDSSCDAPTLLSGRAMQEDKFLADAKSKILVTAIRNVYFYKMSLAFLFGDLEVAKETYDQIMIWGKGEINAHFICIRNEMIICLTYLGLARKKDKNKYINLAKKKIAIVVSHIKNGNVNCFDMLLLMQAELLAVTGTSTVDEVRAAYDRAVAASNRSGFIHNAALANELAASYFHDRNDNYWSSFYLDFAYDLWGRYGARGKVLHLEKGNDLLRRRRGSSVVTLEHFSGNFAGRARFNRNATDQHQRLSFETL